MRYNIQGMYGVGGERDTDEKKVNIKIVFFVRIDLYLTSTPT